MMAVRLGVWAAGRRAGHGWALKLTLVLGSMLSLPGSAAASIVKVMVEPVDVIDVEIDVADSIDGHENLRKWVDEVARSSMPSQSASGEPLEGVVRVEIKGELYDYTVALTAWRGREQLGEPFLWKCECSNEELLDGVRQKVPTVASRLVVEVARESCQEQGRPSPTLEGTMNSGGDGEKRGRLSVAGQSGVALMALGALGVGVGVPLAVLGDYELPLTRARGDIEVLNLRPAGYAAAGAGAGVFVTGVTLLALQRRLGGKKGNKQVVLVPFDGQGRSVLSVSGRF